ncbi:MAG: asparagine synthase (glutamine-hydrolyzing) [Polyangiales bacterium]|jgi:asparagine synthase (glutamine-hydrolysing)
MCSILAILQIPSDAPQQRAQALKLSATMRHRGPDWSGVHVSEHAILAHERLSIVDINTGAQPLVDVETGAALAVNGEIYNHRDLRAEFDAYPFQTESDCEVILALYGKYGVSFLDKLRGMFAFVLYDGDNDRFVIARDHQGIIPLYWGRDEKGQLYVASEMKALVGVCETLEPFPPGHYFDSAEAGDAPVRYWERDWFDFAAVEKNDASSDAICAALSESVHGHLMSDVPYGVLLSGGLDSSITAAVAAKYAEKRIETDDEGRAWWPRLHSFAIGLEGSPDLEAAQHVADHIGTVHHAFQYTIQDGIDALRDVIYHIETYDVTSIRASTPMYLLARKIKAMGIKMVLSGEGADEIFGGYLYFHKAPNAREFHEETVRKLATLDLYDCLRANKSMAAWGVEARVPFLDKKFMDVAMRTNPEAKMVKEGMQEKQILREAFKHLLPERVYKRQKEQFSDGVGYGWIDSLRAHAEENVSDAELKAAASRFEVNPPTTKEGYFYRCLFEEHFPGDAAARTVPGGKSVACSTPVAIAWDEAFAEMADPSGRAVNVHNDSY